MVVVERGSSAASAAAATAPKLENNIHLLGFLIWTGVNAEATNARPAMTIAQYKSFTKYEQMARPLQN